MSYYCYFITTRTLKHKHKANVVDTCHPLWGGSTTILDAEDSLEIVNGTELEPVEIAEVLNLDNTSANSVEGLSYVWTMAHKAFRNFGRRRQS